MVETVWTTFFFVNVNIFYEFNVTNWKNKPLAEQVSRNIFALSLGQKSFLRYFLVGNSCTNSNAVTKRQEIIEKEKKKSKLFDESESKNESKEKSCWPFLTQRLRSCLLYHNRICWNKINFISLLAFFPICFIPKYSRDSKWNKNISKASGTIRNFKICLLFIKIKTHCWKKPLKLTKIIDDVNKLAGNPYDW